MIVNHEAIVGPQYKEILHFHFEVMMKISLNKKPHLGKYPLTPIKFLLCYMGYPNYRRINLQKPQDPDLTS